MASSEEKLELSLLHVGSTKMNGSFMAGCYIQLWKTLCNTFYADLQKLGVINPTA